MYSVCRYQILFLNNFVANLSPRCYRDFKITVNQFLFSLQKFYVPINKIFEESRPRMATLIPVTQKKMSS